MEKFEIGDFLYIKTRTQFYTVKLVDIKKYHHEGILITTSDKTKKLFKILFFNIITNKNIFIRKVENPYIIKELELKYKIHLLQES